jgi:hypothetical protein
MSYTYFSNCRILALIMAAMFKDGRQNGLKLLAWNVHQVISYTSDIRLTKNLCWIWSAELSLRFGLAHGLMCPTPSPTARRFNKLRSRVVYLLAQSIELGIPM